MRGDSEGNGVCPPPAVGRPQPLHRQQADEAAGRREPRVRAAADDGRILRGGGERTVAHVCVGVYLSIYPLYIYIYIVLGIPVFCFERAQRSIVSARAAQVLTEVLTGHGPLGHAPNKPAGFEAATDRTKREALRRPQTEHAKRP